MKKYDIRVLILSRSRSDKITTVKLLPDYIEVLVPESQKSEYEEKIKNPVITTPDNIIGMGMLRNWILDNIKEETVIMLDDDIMRVYCNSEEKARAITDPEELLQILINDAVIAKDMGVHVFGFTQTDIRKYNGTEPFKLNSWVSAVWGIIGRKYRFRDDKFKVDIDYCLQSLLVDRILFQDTRYYFFQHRDDNTGGNSLFRTQEEFEKSTQTLIDKWGDCIKVSNRHKNQIRIALNVKRKQPLDVN